MKQIRFFRAHAQTGGAKRKIKRVAASILTVSLIFCMLGSTVPADCTGAELENVLDSSYLDEGFFPEWTIDTYALGEYDLLVSCPFIYVEALTTEFGSNFLVHEENDGPNSFRVSGPLNGSTTVTSTNVFQIYNIGDQFFIIPFFRDTTTKTKDVSDALLKQMQSRIGQIKNKKGETIPGLSVVAEYEGTKSDGFGNYDVYRFTLTADSSYDFDAPGNEISFESYKAEAMLMLNFYKPAKPTASGELIAKMTIPDGERVNYLLTGEESAKAICDIYKGNYEKKLIYNNFTKDDDAAENLIEWLNEGDRWENEICDKIDKVFAVWEDYL